MNELENLIDAAQESSFRKEEKVYEAAARKLISIHITPQAYSSIVETMDTVPLETYSEAIAFLSSRYLDRR